MDSVLLHTGARIPSMGLGTWQLTEDTSDVIARAIELGYRLIDTSGDYGAQPGIGEGLRRSGVARSEIYLVTKVEEDEDAYESTRRNLDELQVDYADLMLIHRPPASGAGQDLWHGLIRARDEGLTKSIGVSNYPIALIRSLISDTDEKPAVNQIEWSPFGFSDEMIRYATDNDIVIQAYSPLTRAKRLEDERLVRIAQGYGKTAAQVLIRWNIQKNIVPIPKANNLDHLRENIDVFDFSISVGDMRELDALNERYSSLGSLPYP